MAYLDRCNAEFNRIVGVINTESRMESERYIQIRETVFTKVEECIEWVEKRLVNVHFLSEFLF